MPAARSLALPLALLAWSALPLHAERTPRLTISSVETIHHHMRRRDVERACGVRGIDACTACVEPSFACRCEADGDGWKLAADVHLALAIHLSRPRFLAHERAHIDDVHASLERFFGPFLAKSFADRAECDRLARTLSGGSLASDVMHDLLAASNERIGCAKKLPKGDD